MASHDLLPCRCPICGQVPECDGGRAWCSGAGEPEHEIIGLPLDQWNTRAAETELREALKTAAKRLTTLALASWASGKFDPTNLPDAAPIKEWADEARAALSNTGGGG